MRNPASPKAGANPIGFSGFSCHGHGFNPKPGLSVLEEFLGFLSLDV
jgi:hypothetical protein